ncbi:hypothetical protein J6590_064426 [Homalodisca vitripennis]|nr:hypothetical protein J6590_064426 [Homalodisca vitripennis]
MAYTYHYFGGADAMGFFNRSKQGRTQIWRTPEKDSAAPPPPPWRGSGPGKIVRKSRSEFKPGIKYPQKQRLGNISLGTYDGDVISAGGSEMVNRMCGRCCCGETVGGGGEGVILSIRPLRCRCLVPVPQRAVCTPATTAIGSYRLHSLKIRRRKQMWKLSTHFATGKEIANVRKSPYALNSISGFAESFVTTCRMSSLEPVSFLRCPADRCKGMHHTGKNFYILPTGKR